MPIRLMILLQCILASGAWGSGLSGNTIDDLFTVKSLSEGSAVTEGQVKGLKEGDSLYFARSPFKFKVTAIKGKQVTVELPAKHDLAVGQNLMRNLTDQTRKAMDTEKRLKQALDE